MVRKLADVASARMLSQGRVEVATPIKSNLAKTLILAVQIKASEILLSTYLALNNSYQAQSTDALDISCSCKSSPPLVIRPQVLSQVPRE